MNTEELRFADGYKKALLNGVPVLVKISLVADEAYILLPQRRIVDESGNVIYQNCILGAKDAKRLGHHLELCK